MSEIITVGLDLAKNVFQVHGADAAELYVSPLAQRIADIRERILASSRAHGWTIDPAQLDDRHIVRRMILKRVIFGVDKNPMAVELAKVALWLHTFTVGAPLSFLDHHLRAADASATQNVKFVELICAPAMPCTASGSIRCWTSCARSALCFRSTSWPESRSPPPA